MLLFRACAVQRSKHVQGVTPAVISPLVVDARLCQHGSNHRSLHFLIPPTSDLQMAAETVLYLLVLHDHRLRCCPKSSRSVRAPGDTTGRRQLLRLWLGGWAWWGVVKCAFSCCDTSPAIYSLIKKLLSCFCFTERTGDSHVSQCNSYDEEQESQ